MLTAALDAPPIPASIANAETSNIIGNVTPKPATGKPAKSDLTSVTIISENGTLADGLSTALFVMGLDKAIAYWQAHASEFDAVLCTEDETLYVTEGIQDAFSANYPCEIIQQKGAES